MSSTLPKLSYVLLSHNREKYIRAAIESAFAQDYEGELEYIFSDDCSTDRTFEIIQECVAAYKGKRRVVVTQTPQNLHLAGNTNHAVQFVESDWIVRADDDDISTPDRCSIVGAAIAANPGCSFVYTLLKYFSGDVPEITRDASCTFDYEKIDPVSGTSDFWASFSGQNVLHQVWSARHFKEYGPLPLAGYWVDDVISNMRCCTIGYGVKINVVTALIRQDCNNMSHGQGDASRGYASIIKLEKFHDAYFNTTYTPLSETIEAVEKRMAIRDNKGKTYIESLKKELRERALLCTFWRKGTLNRLRISCKLGHLSLLGAFRCLPMPLYALLLHCYRIIKRK